MENNFWKQDSRLKNISPDKLNILTNIIEKSNGKSNTELIPFFLEQTARANSMGYSFSDEETELIIDVLKTNMTAEQIKRIDIIKKMSKMIYNKNNKK